MKDFLSICERVGATCRDKFPAALEEAPALWAWAAEQPLYQEFRIIQARLDAALEAQQQVKAVATEWGRKYLELARAFTVWQRAGETA